MRQFVEFTFGGNNTEFTVAFDSVEAIDFVIESLEELRAELEHKIEMEKQRKREKKMRKRMREKQWIEQQEKELEEKAEQFIDSLNLREKISIPELDYGKIADLLKSTRKDSEEDKELKHILKESLYNITKGMYDSMDEKTKKILKPLIDEFDKIYKSQSGWSSSSRK